MSRSGTERAIGGPFILTAERDDGRARLSSPRCAPRRRPPKPSDMTGVWLHKRERCWLCLLIDSSRIMTKLKVTELDPELGEVPRRDGRLHASPIKVGGWCSQVKAQALAPASASLVPRPYHRSYHPGQPASWELNWSTGSTHRKHASTRRASRDSASLSVQKGLAPPFITTQLCSHHRVLPYTIQAEIKSNFAFPLVPCLASPHILPILRRNGRPDHPFEAGK